MIYTFEEARDMEDILMDFIKALVADPEEVEIVKTESATTVIYTVDVLPDDVGKIIGRGGSVINSLKVIFKALGCKHGKKVLIEIKE